MAAAWFHRHIWMAAVLGGGWLMAGGGGQGWAQESAGPGRTMGNKGSLGSQLREESGALGTEISAKSRRAFGAGSTILEWQWSREPRFVRLVGGAEPAVLEESVRVSLANQDVSTVQVTFHAKAPEGGFPAGAFAGKKEISYTVERVFSRLDVLRNKIRAVGSGPFKLVAADPEGHSLAEFSTLGGIAKGRNMVAAVDAVFKGENTFVVTGRALTFVNERYTGDTRDFPAQIVLEAKGAPAAR